MLRAAAPSIESWLATATRGLCAEAKDRIRDEIQGHISEALIDMEKQGIPFEERIDLAVRQLGSARTARRAYRRQWMTWLEAQTHRPFEKACEGDPQQTSVLSRSRLIALASLFLLMTTSFLFFGTDAETWIYSVFYVGLMLHVITQPIGRVIVNRLGQRRAYLMYAALALIPEFLIAFYVGALGVSHRLRFGDDDFVFRCLAAGGVAFALFHLLVMLRIWRKLYANAQPGSYV